jgi:hypothetical protein
MNLTPEQRQYAIGGVVVLTVIAVLALMYIAFGAYG